ncbi:hypothetical protein AB0B89_36040, partial [Sphaerisporangium sp. NPDC049002]|uniref:hypothetical protein n=1 Tax=Sphaerisporangium sp. NPDC049002 TaxID=3155392 RepID=UPI00340294BA
EQPLPYPAVIEDVTASVKTLLACGDGEAKAGRVLSGLNATRLRAAVEQLISVLRAAGMEVASRPEPDDVPPATEHTNDSTAPSAREGGMDGGKVALDPALAARAYRVLAEAASRR